jgi:hypothetical protein
MVKEVNKLHPKNPTVVGKDNMIPNQSAKTCSQNENHTKK